MDYELSDSDLKQLVPGLRVYKYPELAQFQQVEDLLDANGRAAILFLTEGPSEGHWICLSADDDTPTLTFFDSYGLRPDSEFSWLSHDEEVALKQTEPFLLDLLRDAHKRGWEVEYSPYHLQSKRHGVETCGRHVATRLLHSHLPIDEYKAIIDDSGLTPDQYVLEVTSSILGR